MSQKRHSIYKTQTWKKHISQNDYNGSHIRDMIGAQ